MTAEDRRIHELVNGSAIPCVTWRMSLSENRSPLFRDERALTPVFAGYALQRMQAAAFGERGPEARRRRRHIDMADAVSAPERIDDRVHHSGTGADGARLACPFDTERIGAAAYIAGLERKGRHIAGARQRI